MAVCHNCLEDTVVAAVLVGNSVAVEGQFHIHTEAVEGQSHSHTEAAEGSTVAVEDIPAAGCHTAVGEEDLAGCGSLGLGKRTS